MYFIFPRYLCSYEIITDIIRDNIYEIDLEILIVIIIPYIYIYIYTVYMVQIRMSFPLLSLVLDSYFEDNPCSINHSSCSFLVSLVAMFLFFYSAHLVVV